MSNILFVIHSLIVLMIIGLVLLQRSEGGVLGMSGGGVGGLMTGRGQRNALTRATAILAGLFFATSLGISILAGWEQKHMDDHFSEVIENSAPLTSVPTQQVPQKDLPPNSTGPHSKNHKETLSQQKAHPSGKSASIPAPQTP